MVAVRPGSTVSGSSTANGGCGVPGGATATRTVPVPVPPKESVT